MWARPEVAHGLGDVLVDGGLLAGQQGRRHAALRPRQGGEDARRDVGAQRIDGAHDAVGAAVLDHRRRRQRIAHGAELLVPGDPLEIEGAGCGRAGRRREVGEHQQPVADMDRRRALGERHAHAHRHHLGRRHAVALQAHRLEHDPHALGQALDVGDAALDIDAEQGPAECRRGEARGAPGDEAKAEGGGQKADARARGRDFPTARGRPGRARPPPAAEPATARARSAARNRRRCPAPSPPAATASSGCARRRADRGSRCVPPPRRLPLLFDRR